jgi:hypothetical protein
MLCRTRRSSVRAANALLLGEGRKHPPHQAVLDHLAAAFCAESEIQITAERDELFGGIARVTLAFGERKNTAAQMAAASSPMLTTDALCAPGPLES